MARSESPTSPAPELLPDSYDRLISIDRLVHGEHNPRRVAPTETLERSIERDGIAQPLIVRPDPDRDVYHVTDGWQRYQAATACGWELLPVRVYDSPLQALRATETASIVREWSTYEWARYCQSLATELNDGTGSRHQLAKLVASQTTKSPQTVRRYLDALSLPSEIHPLLCDGPDGSEADWQALKHYNESIRRYTGLPWHIAARLGKRADECDLTDDRIIAIAANAVAYAGLFLIPGIVGGAILGDRLMSIYGSGFAIGAEVLPILLVGILAYSYTKQLLNTLNGIDRPDLAFRANAAFIGSNLVLNVALVYTIGWVGAAIATATSAGIGLLFGFHYTRKHVAFTVPYGEIARQWAAALGMGLVVYAARVFGEARWAWIPDYNAVFVVGLVGLGAVVYFSLLFSISTEFRTTVANNLSFDVPLVRE